MGIPALLSHNNDDRSLQKGFTIIELLIATTIFSFAFGMIAMGFVEITKLYRQGISIRTVQQNARFLMDDIVRTSRPADSITSGADWLKIEYPQGQTVSGEPSTILDIMYCNKGEDLLRYENVGGSDCSLLTAASGESLLDTGVKVLDFSAETASGDTKNAYVGIKIGIGATDILVSDECVDGPGRQYCAVTDIYASVTARGGTDG